jgi:hypothetical protein
MTQEKLEQPSMYCRQCGYALVGLSEDRCPECARPFSPADPRTFFQHPRSYQRRWWIKRIALTLATVVLLGAVFVAACFGWVYWQYHADWQAEQQAIAALKAAAGDTCTVTTRAKRFHSSPLYRLTAPLDYLRDRVWVIALEGRPRSQVDLAHLAVVKQCSLLGLIDLGIENDQLRHLGGLTQLTVLNLTGNPAITDEGLLHLKALVGLEGLVLHGTRVSGAGLRHLQGMTRLGCLRLGDTQFSREDLPKLKAFPSLDYLGLEGLPVTDADLVRLKTLPLEQLALSRTWVTDAGLAEVGQMTRLQSLNLSEIAVTDAGLHHLSGLTILQWLYLDNTAVTDAGLEHLKGLPNLRALSVQGTKVTAEGIGQLKQTTPSLNRVGP